jgi:para-aminobenzoate synthetase component 1
MTQVFIEALSYQLNSEQLFERIRHLPRPVLLDSSYDSNGTQRFDIISANPVATLTTDESGTLIRSSGVEQCNEENPFALLKQQLAQLQPADCEEAELPFHGGAIGYLSYDLGRVIEHLPNLARNDVLIPLMDIGIYLWALIRDHQQQKAWFVAHPACDETERNAILSLVKKEETEAEPSNFKLTANFKSNMTVAEYKEKYHRIIDYIKAGDCYQVNLAQRFEASYEGDEWFVYQKLSRRTDAPFSAFMQTEDYALVSLSPERFIEVSNGKVETKPIKGTRPRDKDPEKDRQYAQLLKNSTKDRAENLMIVDLLRNDLSKACELGSVCVPKLFDIEGYSNVHHMVSTVQGKLAADKHAVDLLEGCFPGGSITGAPKLRAMEIIEELEPHRRTAYCGSIAYIDCNGNMDSSILIRTLVCHDGRIYCWGGGGIVADSDADKEYSETLVKVSHLMEGLA